MANDKFSHPGYDALSDTIKTPRPVSDPLGATTDFSKVKTIGSLRSDRSNSMHDNTPRDILIEVLGMIDSGEIDPDTLVICYGLWDEEDEHTRKSGFRVAATDSLAVSGLLTRISYRFNAPDE